MTVGATTLNRRRAALSCDRPARRAMFYPKTDPDISDGELRALKERAPQAAKMLLPAVGAAAAEAGFPGRAELIAVGTYHAVYRIDRRDARPVVVRATLPDLFERDRSLLLDGRARSWLGRSAGASLVPKTHLVRFAADGAPFDFAIADFAAGVRLEDALLDGEPAYLAAMGEALRRVHEVAGEGAGLVDLDRGPEDGPIGVHHRWADYIALKLDRHIAACVDIGCIDSSLAARIARAFDAMRPALTGRAMRLLHGDPGLHNICVDADAKRVTDLLDWEDALVGDPLFDVAMWSTFQPPRRLPAFLAGYGLPHPSAEEQRLIALYFLRIALSKTVHRHRFAIADRPDRSPGHHRIMRGLDELERLL